MACRYTGLTVPGQYVVRDLGLTGHEVLLCYPGGGGIALATGVNLNLEMNPKELGEPDVIRVQMG